MENFEINIGGTDVTFMVTSGECQENIPVTLTEAKKIKSRVNIPEIIEHDGKTYVCTAIGKKAFLSSKSLQFLSLPASVRMFDDWAFGKCINLKQVVICGNSGKPVLGRGVFDSDERLELIDFGGYDKDTACLLGLATRMNAVHLFTDGDLGEISWFSSWDKELVTMLGTPDEAGFDELALCGEEDIILSLPEYVSASRRRKASLVLNRLLHSRALTGDFRERYEEYITGRSLLDAWAVIKSEYSENLDMLKMYADIGAISENNIDNFLDDLGEEQAAAKAFLIRYKRENFNKGSIFDDLEL